MTGCDYMDNIKGIGFLTLLRAFLEKNSKEALFRAFRLKDMKDDEIQDYLDKVDEMTNVFKFQIVFDPKGEKLVRLNAPKNAAEKNKLNKGEYEFYTGKKFKNYLAFVSGELNFETLQPRPKSDLDFDKILNFFSFRPNPEMGYLNNLCKKVISFDNFEQFQEEKRVEKKPSVDKTKAEKSLQDSISKNTSRRKYMDVYSQSTKFSPKKLNISKIAKKKHQNPKRRVQRKNSEDFEF